jgi:hypothetical protein
VSRWLVVVGALVLVAVIIVFMVVGLYYSLVLVAGMWLGALLTTWNNHD